jgi:hypothetical protein
LKRAEFFLAQTKTQREENGERILLGDNQGDAVVMLRLLRFRWF